MKRIFIIALSLVFLGAGCFGKGASVSKTDGGVFKTVNAGQEWTQAVIVPTAAGIGTLATTDVLNMTMDPQDKNYLYIGTRQNGMLYSEDAGNSWRQPRESAMKEGLIYHIEVDPTDVCTIYVAKGSRLYRSQDCMRSFNSETYVDIRAGVTVVQVAVDWYDHNTLWLGLSNGDVLKSDDAGTSWRTVLKTGSEISGFLMHKTDSRQVLVSTFEKAIFKTTDSGSTWVNIEDKLDELKRADRVLLMLQDAQSKTVVASTEYGLLRSKDFGSTWEALQLLTSPGQVSIRALGIDPQNPSTMYYAANSTFYHSTDAGVTWNTEKIPSSRVPRALLVDLSDPTVLYVVVAAATE